MLNDLLIWGLLLVGLAFLVVDKRRGYGVLTFAYFLTLSLGHVPGVLAYFDPNIFWYKAEAVKTGFDVTLIGMSAFIVGAMAARILPPRTMSAKAYQQTTSSEMFLRSGWRILTMGIASYFVVFPVAGLVPSLTAVMSVMGELLIVGIWFLLYSAVIAKNSRQILLIFAMLPLLPLATLTTGGFIGYGTVWALSIVAFFFVIARRRGLFYLATPAVVFMGLSLFVTYVQQREEIREVVWYQNADTLRRLEQISKLVVDFQLLDLSNERHLVALDDRLNQNYLVGEGVTRHRAGETYLRYGATVALWALIPRAIWPDKPAVGGGQGLVSEFTGLRFGESTSVGVGQVLEFYMNFGMPGVLAGFVAFGFILMLIDQRLMRAFAMTNSKGVVLWALPGLAMLGPLGNLQEIFVSVASAIIISQLLTHWKLLDSPRTQRPNSKKSGQTMGAIVRR